MTEATAAQLNDWLREFSRLVNENKAYLTDLDSAIGDADHGANMARGMTAAVEALTADQAPIDATFKKVGMALVSNVGGASGPLYGTFFMKFGVAAGSGTSLSQPEMAAALEAGLAGVIARGKAEVGEKTMIDAMTPAVAAFAAAGDDVSAAAQAAALAAETGRDTTLEMVARKGRASYLGERSAGHLDPGSASTAYLFEALATALK